MYKLTPNDKKTWAVMELAGDMPLDEIRKVGDDLLKMASSMNKPFGLISDLSKLGKIPEGGQELIGKIMENMSDNGLSVVARVFPGVDKESLAKYQRAAVQASYESKYFASMDRAKSFMEERF